MPWNSIECSKRSPIFRATAAAICNLGPDVPLLFTAFFPAWKMLDRPPTLPSTLKRAWQIAIKNGVRYAFTGFRTAAPQSGFSAGNSSPWCARSSRSA